MLKKWTAILPPLPCTHLFPYHSESNVVCRKNMDPSGQTCVILTALCRWEFSSICPFIRPSVQLANMTEHLPGDRLEKWEPSRAVPSHWTQLSEVGINMSWKNKRRSSWQSSPYVFAFHNAHESMSEASFLLEKGYRGSVAIWLGHHRPLQLVAVSYWL